MGAIIFLIFSLVLLVAYLLTRAVTRSEAKGGIAMLVVAVAIIVFFYGHGWYIDIYAHFLCNREGGIRIQERHKVDGYLEVDYGGCIGECFEELAEGKYKFREFETADYIRDGVILPPGKYRYYKSQVGDPNCVDQEKMRPGYKVNLPVGVCISVVPVDEFLSKYVVEHKYYNRKNNDDVLSSYPKFVWSKTVIHIRSIGSNEVIASDITFHTGTHWPFSAIDFLGSSDRTRCVEGKGGNVIDLALQGEKD